MTQSHLGDSDGSDEGLVAVKIGVAFGEFADGGEAVIAEGVSEASLASEKRE